MNFHSIVLWLCVFGVCDYTHLRSFFVRKKIAEKTKNIHTQTPIHNTPVFFWVFGLVWGGLVGGLVGWRILKLDSVVNNHGDRFRPLRIGLWAPFQNSHFYGL